MTTNVYIDGFNLYYGALKSRWTQYKWLNLLSFCQHLLPGHSINRVRYFTASVKPTANNPQKSVRQQIYIRALETLPSLSIHYGHFLTHDVQMPLSNPTSSRSPIVRVRRTEEKGSDVNLASYLLLDCFDHDFDEAVVISNDSDLATPIRIVRDRFSKRIGVINPHIRSRRSRQLLNSSSWSYPSIARNNFASSQFPRRLTDAIGTFSKPPGW